MLVISETVSLISIVHYSLNSYRSHGLEITCLKMNFEVLMF